MHVCDEEGVEISETPAGDRGSGGSTFATKAQESIGLKLHEYAKAGRSVLIAGSRGGPSNQHICMHRLHCTNDISKCKLHKMVQNQDIKVHS